jgi:hypothetical protein
MAQFSGRSFWRCNDCGLLLDTFPVMGDEDISDFEESITEELQNNETERPKTKEEPKIWVLIVIPILWPLLIYKGIKWVVNEPQMNYKSLLTIMLLTISIVILILLQRVYY